LIEATRETNRRAEEQESPGSAGLAEARQRICTEGITQKNPWEKIADNIALKEGEYPGTKDVARMRQAILNKKQDN
jgi:hypothetical protein